MLYIGSAFLYSVFCLPVAATSNIAGIFVGRFVTGVISAIPAVTTRLTIEDLFDTEGRMWAFFSWALVTNLGLALGPIYASYVSTSLNWYMLSPVLPILYRENVPNVYYRRWPFYLATIIVAVTGLLTYFIRESHTSHLLNRKVAAIQSLRVDLILRTTSTSPRPSVSKPLILLFTNPLIFLSSLANAFSTALLYLFAVAFPIIYTHYAWTVQKTTLIFLFITLGLLFSTLTRLHDRHTPRKYPLTNDRLAPGSHLFGLAIGAPALAIALWWFAWTIPGTHIHNIAWPASAISLIAIGYGINEHSTVLPRHLLESTSQTSTHDAASAFTALLAARALLSAAFPLFTTRMFEKLGDNVAASVLAATTTVFCLVPFLLLRSAARRNEGCGNSSSNVTGDEESAHEVKNVEKAAKARKSVRWMDETDSRSDDPLETSSESASTSATISDPRLHNQSPIQKHEAPQSPAIASRDFADAGGATSAPETGIRNGSHDDTVAKLDARKRDAERGGVSGTETRVTGIADSEQEKKTKEKKKENEKEEKPKDRTRVDDGDNGAVGFWGLGVDVERVAVFPYF